MKKWFSFTLIGMFFIAVVIGLVIRTTYISIDYKNSNVLGEFYITRPIDNSFFDENNVSILVPSDDIMIKVYDENGNLIREELGKDSDLIEDAEAPELIAYGYGVYAIYEEIKNAKYVVRVRASGDMEFLGGHIMQSAEVLENYGTKTIDEGTKNKLVTSNEVQYEKDIAMKVNFMKKGDEYLVFANSIKANDNEELNIYRLADMSEIAYFNFEDKKNVICPEGTLYKDVCDNEFFAENQEVLRKITEFKKSVFEQYVN